MLRPREVPVAASGTTLVMVLLVSVLRRAPLIIMGMRTTHRWRREEVKLWKEGGRGGRLVTCRCKGNEIFFRIWLAYQCKVGERH